jgi:soluble lytic murein transglycosylase-like protein
MVRWWILASLAALSLQTPARAQVDWRGAGGALFADARASDRADAKEASYETPNPPTKPAPFDASIAAAAARHGLDPYLLRALVLVESDYRIDAVSSAGAAGLTQLMPATARELGVADRFAPDANLQGGATFLAQQLARFGDVRRALAAYNAGPARAARGEAALPGSTRQYVGDVLDCFLALAAGREVRSVRDCRVASP